MFRGFVLRYSSLRFSLVLGLVLGSEPTLTPQPNYFIKVIAVLQSLLISNHYLYLKRRMAHKLIL